MRVINSYLLFLRYSKPRSLILNFDDAKMLKHILIVLITSLLCSNSYATDDRCTIAVGGDNYFDIIKPDRLDEESVSHLEDLHELLDNDWRGTVTQTECIGHNYDLELVTDISHTTLRITEPFSNRLRMTASISLANQKKRIEYRKTILHKRDIISVLSNNDDAYIVTEKAYHRSKEMLGNTLIETVYKVLIRDRRSVQLDIITYTNGFYAVEQRWQLTRSLFVIWAENPSSRIKLIINMINAPKT